METLMLACLSGSAVAQADSVNVFTGSVGGTSDFVFRGLSLTRGKPAAQASIDVEFPRAIYVGGFIATADPNPGPSPAVEIDAWAGRYWRYANGISVDLRVSQYLYPDDPRRVSYNRSELSGTLGLRNRLFVAAIYSPNTSAVGSSPGYKNDGAWALEMSARHVFSARYALSGGVGHYGLEGVYGTSYNYWNATLTASFAPFELQLAWLGADAPASLFLESTVGNRVALTALWRFSSHR